MFISLILKNIEDSKTKDVVLGGTEGHTGVIKLQRK